MRILITGGNGYVGRELVRLLLPEHELCVVDSMRYGAVRLDDATLARVSLKRVDIENGPALKEVVRAFAPDAMIHLAAIHFIPECEADPGAAIRTNVLGTVNALTACPQGCRFVFASSGAVYAPDDAAHDEDLSTIGPTDVYGLSKLHGEIYVRHLAKSLGLRGVVVRLFNVIGPGETNPHLVPEIVAQLKAGQDTIQLGNLWPKRDYIHVRDAARGFAAAALQAEIALGATVTVNLGTSRPYSVLSILRKLRRISGLSFKIEEDRERIRAVDRPYLAAKRTRIRQIFGWQPEMSIDAALTDLWANPDLAERLTSRYVPTQASPLLSGRPLRPAGHRHHSTSENVEALTAAE